jgi:DHA3 family macrolide efflux protein-like MFS transporter
MALLFFLIAPAAFLTPLQTTRTYGPEVWRLTALEIAFSAGMTVGGAVLAGISGFRNRMSTVVASTLVMAVCTAALGLAPPFWAYLAFMVLFGLAIPYFNTPLTTLLQEHVEGDYLGRVYSINSMISSSMMPVGMLAFGPLGDLVRIEILLIATGAAIAALGIGVRMSRTLMEMGEPAPAPKAPTQAAAETASDPAGA